MTAKKHARSIPAEALAAARRKAKDSRHQIEVAAKTGKLFTAKEMADAAPFYFVLREYVRQLKEAREAAGITLAELSARTGMAVESLSRLETGASTNPTWKTLGMYAAALGRRPHLTGEMIASDEGENMHRRLPLRPRHHHAE